jgi:hypothetical protein
MVDRKMMRRKDKAVGRKEMETVEEKQKENEGKKLRGRW